MNGPWKEEIGDSKRTRDFICPLGGFVLPRDCFPKIADWMKYIYIYISFRRKTSDHAIIPYDGKTRDVQIVFSFIRGFGKRRILKIFEEILIGEGIPMFFNCWRKINYRELNIYRIKYRKDYWIVANVEMKSNFSRFLIVTLLKIILKKIN